MTHSPERRMLYVPVLHIETNLVNARQKLAAVNQLERWTYPCDALTSDCGGRRTVELFSCRRRLSSTAPSDDSDIYRSGIADLK